MTTHSEHLLSGFADEMGKIAAEVKKKKSTISDLVKDKNKDKDKGEGQKGKLGNMWRKGSFFGQQTADGSEIAIAYDRDGASAQHHSFEAQASDNSRGQYNDQKV